MGNSTRDDGPMGDSVRAFYDELAGDYHLMYADWHASLRRQAAALDRAIAAELGAGQRDILDCACGIGTQAIGLAQLGHRVAATDLSPAAVARAAREAMALGVSIAFGVADLRSLPEKFAGGFDVILAVDNALPHVLHDDELRLAIANMAATLRPSGMFLASIRDYERLVRERPTSEGPRIFAGPAGSRISFQIWDWADDGQDYTLHQYITRQTGDRWRTTHAVTTYRALLRPDLETALHAAGLAAIRWHEPDSSGFFQPLVTARKP